MIKLLWKDEVTAISVKLEGQILPTIRALEGVEQYKLPFGLFGFDRRECGWQRFMEWCETRIFSSDRVDVEDEFK